MTLHLVQGSKPEGLPIRAHDHTRVHIGDYEVSMQDFLSTAWFVLTNTDLSGPDDPRLEFVDFVRRLQPAAGYNSGRQRLGDPSSI